MAITTPVFLLSTSASEKSSSITRMKNAFSFFLPPILASTISTYIEKEPLCVSRSFLEINKLSHLEDKAALHLQVAFFSHRFHPNRL